MVRPTGRSRHWAFTLNNYTAEDVARLEVIGVSEDVEYLIVGREVAPSGTPHLQGFVSFVARRCFTPCQQLLGFALNDDGGHRPHVEQARGTPYENKVYCSKGGNYQEWGVPPDVVGSQSRRGVASQFDDYKQWLLSFIEETGRGPSEREVANQHPALFCRYYRSLMVLTSHLSPAPRLQEGELRDWQIDLNNLIQGEADDRIVNFIVDPEGNKGKTFFQRWFYTNNSDKSQILSVAKRDDMAHAIDETKTVFLLNVPRGGMEFLQYTILEQLKDRMVFSPKYDSRMKVLKAKTHVCVFCNEEPDLRKMTEDRYNIIYI